MQDKAKQGEQNFREWGNGATREQERWRNRENKSDRKIVLFLIFSFIFCFIPKQKVPT